jgi:hypothetical protein
MEAHDADKWLEILQNHPVLLVLFGGLVGGIAFSEAVKYTYMKLQPNMVPDGRYELTIFWLSILGTFCFTNWLWLGLIPEHPDTFFRHIVSAISAGASPWVYIGLRKVVPIAYAYISKKFGNN